VSQLPLTREETSGPGALIPESPTLPKLREAAAGCTACPLYNTGTQTVFGEGLKRARLMLIGEQPGDREDIEGHPFVGPAGRILDQALEEAKIERGDAYVTNVVKHFKWTPKGKRRIHQAPRAEEIRACSPWLEAELDVVDPEVMVCLGATAVRAVIGTKAKVMKNHGEFLESKLGRTAMPTLHPSAILRADPKDRDDALALLVGDLRRVRDRLAA
jgi:uracil-DNA glycosylase family protein